MNQISKSLLLMFAHCRILAILDVLRDENREKQPSITGTVVNFQPWPQLFTVWSLVKKKKYGISKIQHSLLLLLT